MKNKFYMGLLTIFCAVGLIVSSAPVLAHHGHGGGHGGHHWHEGHWHGGQWYGGGWDVGVYPVYGDGNCQWRPGFWRYGYWHPAHRVCW